MLKTNNFYSWFLFLSFFFGQVLVITSSAQIQNSSWVLLWIKLLRQWLFIAKHTDGVFRCDGPVTGLEIIIETAASVQSRVSPCPACLTTLSLSLPAHLSVSICLSACLPVWFFVSIFNILTGECKESTILNSSSPSLVTLLKWIILFTIHGLISFSYSSVYALSVLYLLPPPPPLPCFPPTNTY